MAELYFSGLEILVQDSAGGKPVGGEEGRLYGTLGTAKRELLAMLKAPKLDTASRSIILRFMALYVISSQTPNSALLRAGDRFADARLQKDGETMIRTIQDAILLDGLPYENIMAAIGALRAILEKCPHLGQSLISTLGHAVKVNTHLVNTHARRVRDCLKATMQYLLNVEALKSWQKSMNECLFSLESKGGERKRGEKRSRDEAGPSDGAHRRRSLPQLKFKSFDDPKLLKLIHHRRFRNLPASTLAELVVSSMDNFPALNDDPNRTTSTHFNKLLAFFRGKKKRKKSVAATEQGSRPATTAKDLAENQVPLSERAKLSDVKLSERARCVLSVLAFERILSDQTSSSLASQEQEELRNVVISKLASQFLADQYTEKVVTNYITDDFQRRLSLACQYLYSILSCDLRGDNSSLDRYCRVLRQLLAFLFNNASLDSNFSEFISRLPKVTGTVMAVVKTYCEDSKRLEAGLQALEHIVLLRVGYRDEALDAIFALGISEDGEIRKKAVTILVENLYTVESVSKRILEHAKSLVSGLSVKAEPTAATAEPVPIRSEEKKDQGDDGKSQIPSQNLDLYYSLCTKRPSLLVYVMQLYVTASEDVKHVLSEKIPFAIGTMDFEQQSEELSTLVHECPPGSEAMMCQIIREIVKHKLTGSVLNAVKELYTKRKDATILVPIVRRLDRKMVESELSQFVSLDADLAKEAIVSILASRLLEPPSLLVALHELTSRASLRTAHFIRKLRNVISECCLKNKTRFGEQELSISLQRMSESRNVPLLFMGTLIKTLKLYPRLKGFGMGLLLQSVNNRVWENEDLWRGFIICAVTFAPESFEVLLQLPAPQLKMVLDSNQKVRKPLTTYASARASSIRPPILQLLGL